MNSKKKKLPPDSSVPRRLDRDRRVRQNARIARVLGVLNLIQSRGRWNLKAIASELECSTRTIQRDLEVLEFAGVPWYVDPADKCYRVRADYQFPTLMLTQDETIGQVVATALSKASGLDISSGASPTTRKLAATGNGEIQQLIADAARMIEVFDLKLVDHSQHQVVVKTLQNALLQGNKVSGRYDSPYEDETVRLTIHPYRLCLVKQAWYVIGHIEGETEAKTFRVARFKSLRMLEEPALVPDQFDLGEYFGNAWSVYRGEKSYQVKLRFEPQAARIVAETIWHHTQEVKQHQDGSVTLNFTVDGLDEILHWVLAWSGKVKVEAPETLRTMLLQELNAAISLNSTNHED